MPNQLKRQQTLSPVFKQANEPTETGSSASKQTIDVLTEAEIALSENAAAKYLVKPVKKKRPTLSKLDTSARKIQAIVRGDLQRSGFHSRKERYALNTTRSTVQRLSLMVFVGFLS